VLFARHKLPMEFPFVQVPLIHPSVKPSAKHSDDACSTLVGPIPRPRSHVSPTEEGLVESGQRFAVVHNR
jgi:hypothetical protein